MSKHLPVGDRCIPALLAIATLTFAFSARVMADDSDLLGLYVGGAVGSARVEATAPYAGSFGKDNAAFKTMVGIRPISILGAELAYNDFGHPSRQNGFGSTSVKMKGESAFGVLYVPIPIIDIFVKAGLARIQSTVATDFACPSTQPCPAIVAPGPEKRTNVGFAGGTGVQFKLGALAIRGEFEYFDAAGGNPSLLSVGATWTFL